MSNRIKFFLSHLSISIMLAAMVVFTVFFIWYPSPLSKALDVTHIFWMLLFIDIILGPVLGFIVYNEKKKSLKFDLAIIIFIQIVALIFGLYSISQGRPGWIVYNGNKFELIRSNDLYIDENNKNQKISTSWIGPEYVGVLPSADLKQRDDELFAEALGSISLAQRSDRYVDLSKVSNQIRNHAIDLKKLNDFNVATDVHIILQKNTDADAWLPLKTPSVDMVVLVNKEKANIVKIVDLRPWD